MEKRALVVIDVINDFVKNREGPLFCRNAEAASANILKLVELFHHTRQQVIYVHDSHRLGDAEFQVRPLHAIQGTWGAQLVDELAACQRMNDYQILKRRHSAFSYTDLDLFLREEKIDNVVLAGGMTNVSIRSTASDAFYQAYKVTVISDCCFSQSKEMHQSGLRDIEMFGSIRTYESYKEMIEKEKNME